MDELKSLKLNLIRRILQCRDPQVLHTVDQVLGLDDSPSAPRDDWLASTDAPPDVEDIRQSIDEIFNIPPKQD